MSLGQLCNMRKMLLFGPQFSYGIEAFNHHFTYISRIWSFLPSDYHVSIGHLFSPAFTTLISASQQPELRGRALKGTGGASVAPCHHGELPMTSHDHWMLVIPSTVLSLAWVWWEHSFNLQQLLAKKDASRSAVTLLLQTAQPSQRTIRIHDSVASAAGLFRQYRSVFITAMAAMISPVSISPHRLLDDFGM